MDASFVQAPFFMWLPCRSDSYSTPAEVKPVASPSHLRAPAMFPPASVRRGGSYQATSPLANTRACVCLCSEGEREGGKSDSRSVLTAVHLPVNSSHGRRHARSII